MKYYALASGSKGNCFVVQDEDVTLMIDCGASSKKYIFDALHKINVAYSDIDALLVTHSHKDHIGQLKYFIDKDIYSFCSLDKIYNQIYIEPLHSFMIKNLKITPIPLSHDCENTVGFVIDNGLEKLVYITDTGYIKTDLIGLIYNPDYIIIESNHDLSMLMSTNRPMFLKQRIAGDSGHLNNEDCASTLSFIVSSKTSEICLAHISEEANTKELAMNAVLSKLKDIEHGNLKIVTLDQFSIHVGGNQNEKDFSFDMCSSGALECLLDSKS